MSSIRPAVLPQPQHSHEKVSFYYRYIRDAMRRPVLTACLVMDTDDYACGLAFCHPDEPGGPSKDRGKRIARGRALRSLITKTNLQWETYRGHRIGVNTRRLYTGEYKALFCDLPMVRDFAGGDYYFHPAFDPAFVRRIAERAAGGTK